MEQLGDTKLTRADVFVGSALVSLDRAMHNVSDGVDEDHDILLQALGTLREVPHDGKSKNCLRRRTVRCFDVLYALSSSQPQSSSPTSFAQPPWGSSRRLAGALSVSITFARGLVLYA